MEQELRDRMERDVEQHIAFQECVDWWFAELIASTSQSLPTVVEDGSQESGNPNTEEDESDDWDLCSKIWIFLFIVHYKLGYVDYFI